MLSIRQVTETNYWLINGFIYKSPMRFRGLGVTAIIAAYVGQKMELVKGELKSTQRLGYELQVPNSRAKGIAKRYKDML